MLDVPRARRAVLYAEAERAASVGDVARAAALARRRRARGDGAVRCGGLGEGGRGRWTTWTTSSRRAPRAARERYGEHDAHHANGRVRLFTRY